MKRTREEHPYLVKGDPQPTVATTGKRPKSTQACSSCRRQKTRCEILNSGPSGSLRCHRCSVLNIHCSFDDLSSVKDSPSTSTVDLTRQDSSSILTPLVEPEDLVPLPASRPWGSFKGPGGSDWTAAPMLALQDLARRPTVLNYPVTDYSNISLADIVPPDQRHFLLETFASRYNPWLNLPSNRDGDSSLLDLVRCTVASRHLDAVTRSILAPRLEKAAAEAVFNHMFNPTPSTDTIVALLIWALWSPVSGTPQNEVRDSRLLVAAAVSMAMNARLSDASIYASSLWERKEKENGLSPRDALALAESLEKAQLWICLTTVESMLCVGTGREPISRRSPADENVISTCFLTMQSGQEMRLGLAAQLFNVTERGYRIRFPSYSEVDTYHKEVLDVLTKMDCLYRLISPLPVVAKDDAFLFHMLLVHYHFCRLLVLHRALREARRILQDHQTGKPWYRQLMHQGICITSVWGREAVLTAEAVLVASLSREENIGTAPDNLFSMISFAAVWLIMAKFAMFHNTSGERIPELSKGLLIKIIERLEQSAMTLDHAPAKCAQLITTSLKMLETGTTRHGRDEEMKAPAVAHVGQPSTAHFPPSDPSRLFSEEIPSMEIPNVELHQEFRPRMHSDIFLDSDLWSSFMSNLSADAPGT